jgi:hypothetical protein
VASILANVVGAALILIALRDVFDVLFNETGRAVLAHLVTRSVWRPIRWLAARRPRSFALAGPFALLAVIGTWAVLLIVGWALIYAPHMPESFNLTSEVDSSGAFVDSLYLSLVTLATVGFGDITPDTALLRVLTPLEALLGLALVTASISWLLSIYPVLSRRRSLAYEVNLLTHSQEVVGTKLLDLEPASAEGIYSELTTRLVAVERDMATFPVAYYFVTIDERFSLPATLPSLLDLAERGTDESVSPRVRLRATMLLEAIDDFLHTVSSFHGMEEGSTRELLEAYARDHQR